MLNQAEIEQFERDGYLRGHKVLTDAQVDELRSELERVVASGDLSNGALSANYMHMAPNGEPADIPPPPLITNLSGDVARPIIQVVNIWEASPAYHRLISHPTITEEIAQLTNASQLRIWHDQIQYKPAETGGVNMWHQDAPLWPSIAPMTEVTAWVALDDVDESNGCMSMVPGSNRWGNNIEFLGTVPSFSELPKSFEGHEISVRLCPVKKGEVHFHHALTWHASHANTSARPRRAIALHYMTENTRYIGRRGHPMEPYIYVADGELLTGPHFPLVWSKNPSDLVNLEGIGTQTPQLV